MLKLEVQEVSMKRKHYTKEFKEEAVKQITETYYSLPTFSLLMKILKRHCLSCSKSKAGFCSEFAA
jgi:hypothetical protein